ncbi:thiamine pyrophosphokinase [Sphingobacterium hungaricum]|uniref:Thiamine pyrophosphokinase n=1 Tax=Sphingobacterium hungaricum TaxID=2082723 RepID=A0A928UWV5_9SPHI|nr:thiamine pyrophosphokinase [Sphingobacterium hungaricum]MBE8712971.1 thiamine pyrophosphokinase [Sphingobacterium hungaricum]
MSSHHIVRENQEPALLIQNVHCIDSESLGQLLEWSPTIVANEDSYEILQAQGFKVDYVLSNNQHPAFQEHLQWEMLATEDFIAEGISLLLKKNHLAVNILANDLNIEKLRYFAEQMTIVWFHQNLRSTFIHSGFEKWKPKGERLFLEQNIDNLSVSGLIADDNNSYSTESDGFYKLNFTNLKPVLLTETL